ncbi:pantoate--beta-alanine ligase [Thiohalorhabdus sp.]|uniref:pantoate--beta-alanine ligase n=1 Tax=Thiohalorhabdus sp. TaxID=3094134 RepID=UPI002FC3CBA4
MQTAYDRRQLEQALAPYRDAGDRIALVPTMGGLHAGHMALVQRARQVADRVVVSLFVNPTQFAPSEDFEDYPRTFEADRERLLAEGTDVLFAPGDLVMFPDGEGAVTVAVDRVTEGLEGASRPHFFTGVATVVTKLLAGVSPNLAVFGKKDYQQLVTVRRLVSNLLFATGVEEVEIVREEDGLAVSSRNAYLSAGERAVAPGFYQALRHAVAEAAERSLAPEAVEEVARRRIAEAGLWPEYAEVRRAGDLEPVTDLEGPRVLLAAAHLGSTRLIDNLEFGSVE